MRSDVSASRTILIDTNVLISLEDYPLSDSESGERAARVMRYAAQLGYTVAIAAGTLEDLERSGDRRVTRLRESRRYPVLEPDELGDLASRAGYTGQLKSNDEIDLTILAVIDQGKAEWLITDDRHLVRRARQAGLHRVMTIDHFLSFVEPSLLRQQNSPAVSKVAPSSVDLESSFFHSLCCSYPEFKQWWQEKVVGEDRTTLLLGTEDQPAGVAVIKEQDPDYGLPDETAKICTFKIDGQAGGYRYGELLLAETLSNLRSIPVLAAFLEVAPNNTLCGWLERFGFYRLDGVLASNGDIVMVKDLNPSRDLSVRAPWEFHWRFGPGMLRVTAAYLVPIRSHWHSRLFPDPWVPTLDGMMMSEACGNAITKVYISGAGIRQLRTGDVLVFVESETNQSVSELGIVEDTLISSDPIEIIEFAGDRTVYSLKDIADMTSTGREQLIVRFRHDRHLSPSWNWKMENYGDLVGRAPAQSIQRVKPEGITWLRNHLVG